ncbi:MAG: phosphoribosylglycinamide formyltransferase 1 [Thermoleophilaceae bacterium]|nr:phosphoribosylglycinamide formyltransferase 1 [Thermoleophilaceae bacterium]
MTESGQTPFRLAVLVSGEGTNLQAILDQVHGTDGIEVACVAASRAEARGLERARAAGVEAEVFNAADHDDREARDLALADWLEQRGVQLVVLAGWMQLLSAAMVRRFAGRIVNVHPALLPSFPGLHAIEQALHAGVRVTGVTVHFVDEGVDTGPIILQRAIDLPYAAAVEEVESMVHGVEHELYPEAIRLIARGAARIDPADPRRVLIQEGDVDR